MWAGKGPSHLPHSFSSSRQNPGLQSSPHAYTTASSASRRASSMEKKNEEKLVCERAWLLRTSLKCRPMSGELLPDARRQPQPLLGHHQRGHRQHPPWLPPCPAAPRRLPRFPVRLLHPRHVHVHLLRPRQGRQARRRRRASPEHLARQAHTTPCPRPLTLICPIDTWSLTATVNQCTCVETNLIAQGHPSTEPTISYPERVLRPTSGPN